MVKTVVGRGEMDGVQYCRKRGKKGKDRLAPRPRLTIGRIARITDDDSLLFRALP